MRSRRRLLRSRTAVLFMLTVFILSVLIPLSSIQAAEKIVEINIPGCRK